MPNVNRTHINPAQKYNDNRMYIIPDVYTKSAKKLE